MSPCSESISPVVSTPKINKSRPCRVVCQPPMEMDEMQRIAMEYVRSHPSGVHVLSGDLCDTVRVVTGNKYLQDEIPYSAVEE